jgi:hypothetical protein
MGANYLEIFQRITADARYKLNIEYGKPRRGHAEGTIKAHIADLEANLRAIDGKWRVSDDERWKLMILIHVHDSFKAVAKHGSAILDPKSHASLARAFLAEFLDDPDLLNIVQYHDLGYAVYRKFQQTGKLDEAKLMQGLDAVEDKDLLLLFSIIDSCTPSKGREMIRWFVDQVNIRFPKTTVHESIILDGPERVGDSW